MSPIVIGNAALYTGDALTVLSGLPDRSVQCCVTSPPYWGLRDYGVAGQLGLEPTPAEYVATMVEVFREVRRVLRDDGTLWLNLGDSYATGAGKVGDCPGGGEQGERWRGEGSKADLRKGQMGPLTQPNRMPIVGLKPKDLVGIPWRVAFALQADGWYLRSDIIWAKNNCMPESVTDRPTKSHEYLFLLSKRERYFYDTQAIAEPAQGWNGSRFEDGKNLLNHPNVGKGNARTFRGGGAYTKGQSFDNNAQIDRESHGNEPNETGLRNKRSVWTVATAQFSEWTDSAALVRLSVSEAQERAAKGSAGGGDIARITSPDCPEHEGLSDHLPKGFCDGLSNPQLQSIRGNDADPDQVLPSDSATTVPNCEQDRPCLPSLDCSARADASIAMPRSTQSRKTDLVLEISEHAILSGETGLGIERSEQLESAPASISQSILESKSEFVQTESYGTETAYDNGHSPQSACRCRYYCKVVTKTSHFATFPPKLIEPCILAGSKPGDTVLDPFNGAGTTGIVALENSRRYIGIDLNADYIALTVPRIENAQRQVRLFA